MAVWSRPSCPPNTDPITWIGLRSKALGVSQVRPDAADCAAGIQQLPDYILHLENHEMRSTHRLRKFKQGRYMFDKCTLAPELRLIRATTASHILPIPEKRTTIGCSLSLLSTFTVLEIIIILHQGHLVRAEKSVFGVEPRAPACVGALKNRDSVQNNPTLKKKCDRINKRPEPA